MDIRKQVQTNGLLFRRCTNLNWEDYFIFHRSSFYLHMGYHETLLWRFGLWSSWLCDHTYFYPNSYKA